ncbi:deoxyribonuclease gamma-like isoform X1 [Pantherophis guttatus]|uniref:Deoxyribonuclease n=1 Tax=Pantherophis guttatus TaxID=94885 RepID=A0A6P9D3H6_PANGU|nr:deoxyribonuclease gamma-like isoform X1 [Pantherophis guttatus]XP_034290059.1 deoxyribonuclease gamma-like isoform X1 [Pantherophis guttatus]
MAQAFAFLFLLLDMMLVAASFKICAFNIRSFGQAKAANQRVMRALVQILSRCDISAVQEVRDSKGLVIQALVQKLNRYDPSHHYSCLESKRLGRSTYKEQHVFVYRQDAVSVMAWCQAGDEDARDFARGPFAVRFHSPYTVASDFVLLLHHTCPREAVHELDLLFEVCMELMHWWKTENVMVLGDLNAGGAYIPMSAWAKIRLRNHPAFHWLISDEEDTTVSHRTCCSYDRIIVHGEELLSAVVSGSAKPYNFTKALGLSEEEALEISDHYPVEVKLKLAPNTQREL